VQIFKSQVSRTDFTDNDGTPIINLLKQEPIYRYSKCRRC